MSSWKGIGSVIAGLIVTVVLGIFTIVLLPLLGITTAEVVGNWLPIWIFLIPLALCPAAGGATTGYSLGTTRRRSAMYGGLAAALGITIFGVIFGLLFLLFMLKMTPAHGQVTDLSQVTLAMAILGGLVGFVAGAALGALGGIGGHFTRQQFGG